MNRQFYWNNRKLPNKFTLFNTTIPVIPQDATSRLRYFVEFFRLKANHNQSMVSL
jgi:hypothetical protein